MNRILLLAVRNSYRPEEVTHFTPGGNPLTNNVEFDDRGYIYVVDRGSLGLHILELTGEVRKIANWKQGGASNLVLQRGGAP